MRALVVSDGRVGHQNQSEALLKHLKIDYDVIVVRKKFAFTKLLAYICDKLHIDSLSFYDIDEIVDDDYDYVVGAGSLTYPVVRVLAKRCSAKSVAMMLPKGFSLNRFDYIFAQEHDNSPRLPNIIPLPINFSYLESKGLYKPTQKSIGIIVGASNSSHKITTNKLKSYLDKIKDEFSDYQIAITTSPRSSKDIEELIESYEFDYELIYSKVPQNPIADFLEYCEYVFISSDSTSMISESVSYGQSCVEVLDFAINEDNKYTKMQQKLQNGGYIHIFDGKVAHANRKVDLLQYAKKVLV